MSLASPRKDGISPKNETEQAQSDSGDFFSLLRTNPMADLLSDSPLTSLFGGNSVGEPGASQEPDRPPYTVFGPDDGNLQSPISAQSQREEPEWVVKAHQAMKKAQSSSFRAQTASPHPSA